MKSQNSSISDSCRVACCRFSGVSADELFIQCRPDSSRNRGAAQQAASVYDALSSFLRQENGSLEHVARETAFFRNIGCDFEQFQSIRQQAFSRAGFHNAPLPASICIEQPPLDSTADLVLNAIAILPREAGSVPRKGQRPVYLGGFHGAPGNAFDQAFSMFCAADEALAGEGMTFQHVVRTWIYLREIDRDYAALNRARTAFFQEKGIALLPASTGVNGIPYPENADFTLGVYAVNSAGGLQSSAMTTPMLNEACTYGSDFSRGLRVVEDNRIALYVSGTASVDECGATLHTGNFESQVHRTLLNLETLLEAQKASYADVVSAVTYLKCPGDAPKLQTILLDRGLSELPNTVVHAGLCRTDLLCEIEAVALLPRAASGTPPSR